jgi:hypothetical protein
MIVFAIFASSDTVPAHDCLPKNAMSINILLMALRFRHSATRSVRIMWKEPDHGTLHDHISLMSPRA